MGSRLPTVKGIILRQRIPIKIPSYTITYFGVPSSSVYNNVTGFKIVRTSIAHLTIRDELSSYTVIISWNTCIITITNAIMHNQR